MPKITEPPPIEGDEIINEYNDDGGEVDPYCYTCHNRGYIIECVDDLCRGHDHCMHGDGEISCPDCDHEWEIY